jgi:Zn-dependent peptidase ImmA (M78 family)/transcriptional regulator with XRE-family HTH domain
VDFKIGPRIARTRERSGRTAFEIADAARVPFEALIALEKGEAADISTAAVARIARILDVDVSEWLGQETAPSQPSLFFRQAGVPDFFDNDRERVVQALREARAVASVDAILGRSYRRADFEPLEVGQVPFEGGYKLAQRVRRTLGMPTEALGSLTALVEDEFGVPVVGAEFHASRLLALTAKERESELVVVLLNREQPNARVHIAHELAHVLFDRAEQDIDYWIEVEHDHENETVKTEQRAKAFAAELLIPLEGLIALVGRPKQLATFSDAIVLARRVGEHFRTPPELTTNHLVNRDYISDEQRDQLLRSLTIPPYKKPEPRPKMLERRLAEALGAGLITRMRARELLGLSAHDPLPAGLVSAA